VPAKAASVSLITTRWFSQDKHYVELFYNLVDNNLSALTPDQSQMYLTTLKSIRTDYAELRDKRGSREDWESLDRRLDVLGEEINRAQVRTTRIEEPGNGDRIVTLQRRIDDGRISKRLPLTEGREFQARLDSIRNDYFRITEGVRTATYEERADISRRLDSLEADLNRFR